MAIPQELFYRVSYKSDTWVIARLFSISLWDSWLVAKNLPVTMGIMRCVYGPRRHVHEGPGVNELC